MGATRPAELEELYSGRHSVRLRYEILRLQVKAAGIVPWPGQAHDQQRRP
jgi:hypothetical protein